MTDATPQTDPSVDEQTPLTEEKKRRIVAFVDYPCIDGLACAWALRQKYPKGDDVELKVFGIKHSENWVKKIDKHTQEGDEIIFADVSPKTKVLEEIGKPIEGEDGKRQRFKSITIYDHHASEAGISSFKFKCKKGEKKALYPKLRTICNPKKEAAALLVYEDLNGTDTKAPEILKWVGKLEPTGTLKGREEYAVASYIDSKRIITKESELIDSIDESLKDFEELTATSRKQMLEKGEPILEDQIKNIEDLFENPMYVLIQGNPIAGDIWIPVAEGRPKDYGRAFDYLAVELGKRGTGVGMAGVLATDPQSGRVIVRLRSNGTTPNLNEVVPNLLATFNQKSAEDVRKEMENEETKSKLNAIGGGHNNAAVIDFKDLDTANSLLRRFTKAQMGILQWTSPDIRHQRTAPRFDVLESFRNPPELT